MRIDIKRLMLEKKIEVKYETDKITECEGIKEVSPTEVEVSIIYVGSELIISGNMKCHVLLRCDRCFEEYRKDIEMELRQSYSAREFDDFIDLDDELKSLFITSMPMKRLCREDCKGLCSGCGANLNYEPCKCKRSEPDVRFKPLLDLKSNWTSENVK